MPISPELCLVDPELAAWARLRGNESPRYTPPEPATAQPSKVRARAVPLLLTALVVSLALNVLTFTRTRTNEDGRTELKWRPVAGAQGYDVILWRGGERVLDLWPTAAHVTLPARWRHHGQVLTPRSGGLLWFVYPVVARSPKTTFGTLVASGRLES
jgi:hypothetical protein